MTTTPTSGMAIQRYKIGYHEDEWGQRSSTPSGIPDASGSWVRYADHVAALAAGQATAAQPAAQQPHRSGCAAGSDEECVQRGCGTNCPAVSPRADSPPAPVLDERDDFEKVFPLPSGCVRIGTGYAATGDSNWAAHTHCERWQGWQARAARDPAGSVTAPAGAALPDGWVPLMLRHEGQYQEEVAYGPPIMMDRLGRWLGKYFDQAAQADSAQAGAVPLDEARHLFDAGWKAAALFCDREDVVADGIIGFGACPQFEAAFSAAHGSKGENHDR